MKPRDVKVWREWSNKTHNSRKTPPCVSGGVFRVFEDVTEDSRLIIESLQVGIAFVDARVGHEQCFYIWVIFCDPIDVRKRSGRVAVNDRVEFSRNILSALDIRVVYISFARNVLWRTHKT